MAIVDPGRRSSDSLSQATPTTIRTRAGQTAPFDPDRIQIAIARAFHAHLELAPDDPLPAQLELHVKGLTAGVVAWCGQQGDNLDVEAIQDAVERALMRAGDHAVARRYILYREEHAQRRRSRILHTSDAAGRRTPLDLGALRARIAAACQGLGAAVDPAPVYDATVAGLYDGMPWQELAQGAILAARAQVEIEPAYTYVAARLLLGVLYEEALGRPIDLADAAEAYRSYLPSYIATGIAAGLLDPALAGYDLQRLADALCPDRDLQFALMGLQTIYDRYLLQHQGRRFELPQIFWLRVAMGLALREQDREERAIAFYHLISRFHFTPATPTLFNAGTTRPQLSSCFLTTVPDDLGDIYKCLRDNALLSKWSGGLGNDWTPIRALGAPIRGTNGASQGVIPFLKVAGDSAVAVNQCFAPETLVHTANGPLPIRDVQVGDLVLGIGGAYREVTEKFVYNQTDPMVGISVKHAVKPLEVTASHPFYVIRGVPMGQAVERTIGRLTSGKLKPEWIRAGELQRGDYMAQVVPAEVVPVAGFTEDDARLYGILLGDGHLAKRGQQWGVSGSPHDDEHIAFVRSYLRERGIHFWETRRGDTYVQIHWASGRGAVRDATTGRIVGAGSATLPLGYADLYDDKGCKRIARRFSHLPRSQTLALVRGLLETDGGVSRGKEIFFTNTSWQLIEGMRYQLLRLGVPTAGQYRERPTAHSAKRSDGSAVDFHGTTRAFDLRVPAVPEIAALVDCRSITKRNWITYLGCIYSRVRSVRPIEVTPFVFDLKVDGVESYMTTCGLAHNGGKRAGAVCAYLEPWHLDVEEFLELRRPTGDERRRTQDLNTALWIPDLFMQRVREGGQWTLFSPDQTPDLHDLYGNAFKARYLQYEALAEAGGLQHKRLPALDLWRRILTALFETGHPWLTWKDPANIRSPQDHAGVIHSSNLCTEILLNTSRDETAVCNLGSINLAAHLADGGLDLARLEATVRTAVRMLDNVIEINYYPTPEAEAANRRHRPVGLGMMGFQDALYALGHSYASQEAVEFADRGMEAVAYYALLASSDLARERGTYASFAGSKWDRGLLPIDTIALLEDERGEPVAMDRTVTMDWDRVREAVRAHGLRNSNLLAIAPTATIATIVDVSPSIEPAYANLYVKSNLSGGFTQISSRLVEDLKRHGLWDDDLRAALKYYDGSLQEIARVPEALKERYRTAFEIAPSWLIACAARRQKWIDMSQSLNLYLAEPSGRALHEIYMAAWQAGLKTTYYLRTRAATQVEKSALDVNRFGIQPRWMQNRSASSAVPVLRADAPAPVPAACSIDGMCEACQ